MCLCCSCAPRGVIGSGVKLQEVLSASESWGGTPVVYPQGNAQIVGQLIEIAPGAETGWHQHPVPVFGYSLAGELEISLPDGRTKRVKAGEAMVEVSGMLHNGRNIGTTPVKIVVFYASSVGQPVTLK